MLCSSAPERTKNNWKSGSLHGADLERLSLRLRAIWRLSLALTMLAVLAQRRRSKILSPWACFAGREVPAAWVLLFCSAGPVGIVMLVRKVSALAEASPKLSMLPYPFVIILARTKRRHRGRQERGPKI